MQITGLKSSASLPAESLPPRTFQQRHCAAEDWCRYFGGSVAFIGSAWYFSQNDFIPGALFSVVGISIIIVHITDKNCGARVKITRAANEILQRYAALFKTADSTAERLQHLEEDFKGDRGHLVAETTALTAETRDIEQGTKDLRSQVLQYEEENTRLQSAALELQKTIESQDLRITQLEKDLEEFTLQNNRFHQELQKITRAAAELNSTEMKFQQDLTGFDEKIAQMQQLPLLIQQLHKEKEELQQEILQLQTQIEAYTQTKTALTTDVKAMEQINKTATETCKEISGITSKLTAQKETLLASQQLLKQLIAQHQKTTKQEDPQ